MLATLLLALALPWGPPAHAAATFTVPVLANAQGVDLVVTRTTAGRATTIPLTIVDECGAWPPSVGGPSAF